MQVFERYKSKQVKRALLEERIRLMGRNGVGRCGVDAKYLVTPTVGVFEQVPDVLRVGDGR